MQFSFNGMGNNAATVRIEGVSDEPVGCELHDLLVPPSTDPECQCDDERADAEQDWRRFGQRRLESGSNQTHGVPSITS
jgi:hypothetical protein